MMRQPSVAGPSAADWRGWIGYAGGNLGKSILWSSFESFLLFYLVSIQGLPVWLAGGVLAAAMICDGIADLTLGYLTEQNGQTAALSRLIIVGAPLAGLGFWLTFALPRASGPFLTLGAFVLCRIGYALCDIGHNTLLLHVARTAREASVVSGLRLVFSAAGGTSVGLAAARLLSMPAGAAQLKAFGEYAAGASSLYVATLIAAVVSARHVHSLFQAPNINKGFTPIAALAGNSDYRVVLAVIAIQACLLPALNRSLPFFGAVLGNDPTWPGEAFATIALGQFLSLPGWMWLGRTQRPDILLAGAHLLAILSVFALALTARTPFGGLSLFMLGAAQAGMNQAIWALLALSVNSRGREESRLGALAVGVFLTTLKCAAGLGNLLITWAVTLENQAVPLVGLPAKVVFIFGLTLAGCACILCLVGRRAWERPASQGDDPVEPLGPRGAGQDSNG